MLKKIVLFVGLIFSNYANSGVILSPVDAVAGSTNNTTVINGVSDFDIRWAINQGGLYDTFDSGVSDFDTYMATNPLHNFLPNRNEWFGALKGPILVGPGGLFGGWRPDWAVFDLGAVYEIDRIALWAEEIGGFSSADVSISTNNVDFTEVLTINPTDNPFMPVSGAGTPPNHAYDYGADIFGFNSVVSAQYIRLDMQCVQPNGTYAGCSMGEIAFSVASYDIPEPSVIALMGAGLAGFGFARRRRQAKKILT